MSERRRFLGFLRPSVEADVDDELAFHIEESARDLEAMGLTPEEARAEARRRFGRVEPVAAWLRSHDRKRRRREARVERIETLLQDIRIGLRKLRQQPGFSCSVIGVLALGIGAATTMFSALDAALLRPLPFQRDDRLVVLEGVHLPFALSRGSTSLMIHDARRMDVFDGVAAYAPGGLNLGSGGSPVRINVGVVTPDLFTVLGVAPAAGRGFTDEEGKPGGADVAIISDGIWRSRFGASRTTLDQDIVLNGKPYRIVGIMPPGFAFPRESAVWIPLRLPYGFADMAPFRQYLPSSIVARLAPGATIEEAGEQVVAHARALADPERPFTLTADRAAEPFRDALVGSRRTGLLLLMGATTLVLLVACANATSLLLARAADRRMEISVRAALGAGRGRLLRQLLVESLLLSVLGGVLGALLAVAGTGLLASIMPASMAGLSEPRVDVRVLGFAMLVAVVTGLLFGLWPALGAARTDVAEVIREGGTGSTGAPGGTRLRRAFVVAELAISLVLAIGAGLMLRSLQTALGNDPGLSAAGVATLELSLNRETYRDAPSRRAFMDGVLERLRATPRIEAAGFINELPLRGVPSVRLVVWPEGAPEPEDLDQAAWSYILHASDDYFRAMGIPLIAGRMARPALDSLAPKEIVISESLARRLFPGESALGRGMIVAGDMHRTIVGVVGSVRTESLVDTVGMQMYMPLAEAPSPDLALVARGTLPPASLARLLQEAVISRDPQQAVYNVRPMEDVIARALTTRRVNTILIASFSLVALALAAVGVYGVIAYSVSRRSREFGIRIALGARAAHVVRLVLHEGMALALVGVVLGLAGAWALRRVLESQLYGVAAEDPLAWAGAALVLVAIALPAMLIPSARATRVDPVRAIRRE